MPPPLRVLLYQGPSPAGDTEAAFHVIERGLRMASAGGADLALFPELFLPGYNCARIAELAQPAEGDWTRRLSLLARQAGCALVRGYAEREGASVYNSAVAIGADGVPLAN